MIWTREFVGPPQPSPRTTAQPLAGPGWVTWVGLGLVLAAAAVLSFSALRDLAVQCRIPEPLAPLFPVCLDAGLAVSTRVWLSRRANPDAERFAAWLTWSLLACTVVANATHQGLAASGVVAPWWLAVLVGSVPPATVGAVVHLAVLAGRQASTERPVMAVETSPDVPAGAEVGDTTTPERPVGEPTGDRAAELIAAGAGRRRLARELSIPEHAARVLLAGRRNGHGSAGVPR